MRTVGIYLFNKVEVLDFAGPFEVFSVASELNDHQFFNVMTIGRQAGVIQSVNGLKVVADYAFDQHPALDILVVPGGEGTRQEEKSRETIDWIRRVSREASITLSVCSGAVLLGRAGLLDGLESTTHHLVLKDLEEAAPGTIVNPDRRIIDHGHVATCGGISAGIDLSLHMVNRLHGRVVGEQTARYMEYGDWKKPSCNSVHE